MERELASRGGGAAELFVGRSRARRYDARDGGIDGISLSDSLWLGLRVFRDGRAGFSFAFRDDGGEIRRMVEAALFGAEASDPDPAFGLPDPAAAPPPEVPLYDPSWEAVTDDRKETFARELESLTLAADPRVRRVRYATLRETVSEIAFRTSAGLGGSQRETAYSATVDAVAEEGCEGQTGYGFGFARRLDDLDPAAIASEAASRAVRMLGAEPLPTGRYAAVLENGAAAELLEVLAPAFLAPNVAKGRSMLAGKAGRPVASSRVRIVDDPLAPAGCGASAFDGEGVPARRNVLVEDGVLRGFLADSFWGRKIGTGTTGSCRRPGPKVPPTAGISNLGIAPGAGGVGDLVREAGAGIVLSEFLGIHTADPVSGDFSVGATGFRFEGGGIRRPVRGFAVSGNVVALLGRVAAVGGDFRWFGDVGAPALAVDGLDAGGT